MIVEASGTQVVGHVGLHALGAFAGRLGVGESLSSTVGWSGPGTPFYDRGRVLTQAMLMLSGGGDSCFVIEALASQGCLFGDVCSDTTLCRTFFKTIDNEAVVRARRAMAEIRAEVWRRTSATDADGPVILDTDAPLVEIDSENRDGAGPHFKEGFGFHPLCCIADDTLAVHLRSGNAADLLSVVDDGVEQLPADISAGHRPGDDPNLVERGVVVRSDSAGGIHLFVEGLRRGNIGFLVFARRQTPVSAPITAANDDPDRRETALNQDGTGSHATSSGLRAAVCEVTDLVDLAGWP